MKITIGTTDLIKGIKKVNKLKVNASLPILNNVLLTVSEDKVTLVKSDLDIILKISIPCEVKEIGSMIINTQDLKLITKLKEDYLTIENDKITTTKKELKIVSQDAEDYPKLTECNNLQWTTTSEDIGHLLEVDYAIAKDDTRPILTGVCIDKNRWITVDGYRIAIREGKYKSNVKVVASGKQIEFLKKFMDKNTKKIEFLTNEDYRYSNFKFDDTEIISKNVEGDFIKYESIIPQSNDNYIKINKKDIIEELNFIKEMIDKNTPEPLTLLNNFENNILTLNCSTRFNVLNSKIKMIDNRADKKEFNIAFNPIYLLESFNSHKDDEVLYIEYSTNVSPAIVTNEIDSNNLDLVLPVRLRN